MNQSFPSFITDISLRCFVSTAVAAQHYKPYHTTVPSEQRSQSGFLDTRIGRLHSNAYPSLQREAVVGRQCSTACCRWRVHDFLGRVPRSRLGKVN